MKQAFDRSHSAALTSFTTRIFWIGWVLLGTASCELDNANSVMWLRIDRVGILLGYATLFVIGFSVWRLWRRTKRAVLRRRHRAELAAGSTRKPVALAISFRSVDITRDVEAHLRTVLPHSDFIDIDFTDEIPPELPDTPRVPIVEYCRAGDLTPRTLDRHLSALRHLKNRLHAEGYTEIHLFAHVPVAFGCLVGALFANSKLVQVYHHPPGGSDYEYWMPLHAAKEEQAQDLEPMDLMAETLADALDRTSEDDSDDQPAGVPDRSAPPSETRTGVHDP